MKKKIVLRLLATVMAATLVVTGVPGTALTGIATETVFASGEQESAITTSSFTVSKLDADNYYAVIPKAKTTDAAAFGATKISDFTWKTGSASYTFENLDLLTEYYVYEIEKASYSTASTATITSTSAAAVSALGTAGVVKTKGIDITDAVVELEQTSYTYSATSITPKVKSITIGDTKITGSDLTTYFTVNNLDSGYSVSAGGTFDVAAKTDVTGQKYEGKTAKVKVTVTPLDLSSAEAAAYISSTGTSGTRTPLTDVNYTASGSMTKTAGSDLYLYAENNTSPIAAADHYYLTHTNVSGVGTATVTVNGIGNYTGTISATYEIKAVKTSATVSDLTVTPTTTSLEAAATTATTGATIELAISSKANPAERTWVTADKDGKYSFTSCDGKALEAGKTYYVDARIKATANNTASDLYSSQKSASLATGDLSQATITLTEGTTAVTDKTYTYDGTKKNPTVKVTLGGTDLTSTNYTVTYNYIESYNDKGEAVLGTAKETSALTDAGTVRVTIKTGSDGKYCGTKYVDFVINKKAVYGTLKLSTDDSKMDYSGTPKKVCAGGSNTTLTISTDQLPNVSDDKTKIGNLSSTGITNKGLTLNLSGSDKGTQTVKSVEFDYNQSNEGALKNYDVTIVNLSDLKVTVSTNSSVAFTDKAGTGNVTTAQNITYGKTLTLSNLISNTAGLTMTYSVVSGSEEYISVDSKTGVVTLKKFKSGSFPQVKVSVVQEKTDNYDTTKLNPVIFTLTPGQASVTVSINGKGDQKTELSVLPTETEEDILKALNITLSYADSEADGTHNKVITLDKSNSTVTYVRKTTEGKTTYTSATEGLPTEEDTYYMTVTYNGADANYLDAQSYTGNNIELTISKSAVALNDKEVSSVSVAPTISGDTEFTGSTVVTITAGSGATIYYTTDETVPTTESKKYTAAFSITEDTVVKAIAVENDKTVSTVTTATFTKKVTEDDPEEQLKKAQDELEQAKKDLATAQQAAKDAESDKASAVEAAKKEATEAAEKAAAEKLAAAEKAQKDAEDKAAAAEKAKTEAQAAQKAAEDKAAAATTTAATKVGDTVKVDGNTYKVTNVKSKTVSFAKVKKNAKTVNIVSSVEINGVTYKVTSIAASAFKGDKKLTSVTIPATVKTIGANAFNGCTKLKTITINSSKITKIGSKAFSGVKKTAVVKAPSKKLAAYKKLLKKAKFTGKVKKA